MVELLKYFLLVCEERTITGASKRAFVTQPALSGAISRLEEDLGTPLFLRTRGGVTLTAAGEALVPRAKAVMAAIEDARRAVIEVRDIRAGRVRVGGGATACAYYLPPVLAKYRAEYPSVKLLVREGTSESTIEAVEAGELDLGIVSAPRGEYWRDDALILVAAPEVQVKGAPFVTFPPGATVREALDRHFGEVEIVMELSGIASVIEHAAQGIGIALVSRVSVEDALADGTLLEIKDPRTPLVRPLKIVHRGLDRLSPAAAALHKLLLASRTVKRKKHGRPAKTLA
ncbi:MAG: LysR family transcriptional regulator [Deltaproteobacteria bacterium]|nr:LysR family transcriptional regulator [Deltaproteobacteria bacterium]